MIEAMLEIFFGSRKMKFLSLAVVMLLTTVAFAADAHAQRRGGGGGGRSFSSGGSRTPSAGGMNRSSRSSDFNRGGNQSFGGSSFGNSNNRQPSSNTRSFSMPNSFSSSGNNAGNRRNEPGSLGQARPNGNFNNGGASRANKQFERPSQNQLDDFLNMPKKSGDRERSGGNSAPNDYNGKTYQGKNYTVDSYREAEAGRPVAASTMAALPEGLWLPMLRAISESSVDLQGQPQTVPMLLLDVEATRVEKILMVPLLVFEAGRGSLPTANRLPVQEPL